MDKDDPGFDFRYGQGIFSSLQNVQMDFGTHLPS